MHTRPTLDINNDLAEKPEVNFTSVTAPTFEIDDALPGPETITPKGTIEAKFAVFSEKISHANLFGANHPQPNKVYDFDELGKVDKGEEVGDFGDADHSHLRFGAGRVWCVERILALTGVKLD